MTSLQQNFDILNFSLNPCFIEPAYIDDQLFTMLCPYWTVG